jgi:hypothetical protein
MRLALVGAFGLTKLIASVFTGVETRDPIVFVGIPVLLSVVSLIAVWVPARHSYRSGRRLRSE